MNFASTKRSRLVFETTSKKGERAVKYRAPAIVIYCLVARLSLKCKCVRIIRDRSNPLKTSRFSVCVCINAYRLSLKLLQDQIVASKVVLSNLFRRRNDDEKSDKYRAFFVIL